MNILGPLSFVALGTSLLACNSASSSTSSSSINGASPNGAPQASTDKSSMGLIVDHTNAARIDSASPEQIKKLTQLNVFFAHASVGGNIVEGLRALHQSDPNRYPLIVDGAGARPTGNEERGHLYEFNRGNPGAQAKIDQFAGYVSGGWSAANIVVDKFCYIDPDANFQSYVRSMGSLEKNYPKTLVVYTTIPVCTGQDGANDQRETFNNQLREYAKKNNKALLDIADIESVDPDGTAHTYAKNGQTMRLLYSGYTSDGGHLNEVGSAAVAKGFYSLVLAYACR
ncbi:MAG: SGNH/GDSL hydrolase family protein [Armatimonadetes bacterium]|nr:SGNH/GDSL hydrolase family protein [Armatimonadota bacterium]